MFDTCGVLFSEIPGVRPIEPVSPRGFLAGTGLPSPVLWLYAPNGRTMLVADLTQRGGLMALLKKKICGKKKKQYLCHCMKNYEFDNNVLNVSFTAVENGAAG